MSISREERLNHTNSISLISFVTKTGIIARPATKRAMAKGRAARAMTTAVKRAMTSAARAMATVTKRAKATNGEGNDDGGKSDCDSNKEGKGKGGKRDG